ncbi:conjugal transfer protein TraO [Flavobacterium sp. xlx-214]|uniref:conjugal transfer protein TraO n=1 Tax=unclassified Flavobacterium TaxID=196869 RepID=UPI0013D28D26|nr:MULTISPECIES: conjugal transfer protein TraO [unclassified Flavobacterium]MBA5793480.1 conjugal transfer protein TraO [Flavobacterium sp. xlx-221]QMI82749.1 conjugal transfer protein TraO [Flavobacterium sp. xlx-214]
MNYYIFTLLLLILNTPKLHAQRLLPNQKGLEIKTGITDKGKIENSYFINLAITVNTKNGNYHIWGIEYTYKNHFYNNIRIPQETYTAEGGYSFFLLGDTQRNITLNFGITGVGGYESINRGKDQLQDGVKLISKDHFIYGVGGRLTFETYLSDRLVFLLQGRSKILWGTDLQQIRPSAGLGLRINF